MFAKLFNKQSSGSQKHLDLNPRVIAHYGIPSTASRLAHDPFQQLLAVGTLDGRIKIIGSDMIEGLLTSPKEIPLKNLEFLQNQGLLISITNENDVQVWDLEHRCIAASLQWQSNITAFAVIQETNFMYIGDEGGLVSVLKYDAEEGKLLQQKFSIPALSVSEAAGTLSLDQQSIVGVLPQPCSCGLRVVFAYNNGVIVLWDVSKDQAVLIQGLNGEHLNDGPLDNSTNTSTNEQKDKTVEDEQEENKTVEDEQEENEIVSLCWASLDGSILAVGYVDGDIMLWNLSGVATTKDHSSRMRPNDPVKLQLSSADKRFPIIVLHWSANGESNDHGGQLFVYGGDKIGSSEVLTILSLEWSPGRDALKNVKRANIILEGSFADMVSHQSSSAVENTGTTTLFLLSSPGQLQFYDSSCLSALISHEDKSNTIPVHYRSAVPTTEPDLTVGQLFVVHGNTQCSMAFSEVSSAFELEKTYRTDSWPLNGGVPCQMPVPGERVFERMYIAGYRDGSVRVWDATYPMLSLLCSFNPEVISIPVSGMTASVSALDFSCETLSIAVGNESGMVGLYNLTRNSKETMSHVIGTKSEVYNLDEGNTSQLSAVFTLSTSPVSSLRYTKLGAKLAAGYESGQVALLDIKTHSVLFFIDALSSSSSSVIALSSSIIIDGHGLTKSPEESEPQEQVEPAKELILALRKDVLVAVLDCSNGDVISSVPKLQNKESTAISMYILDGWKCVSEMAGGTDLSILNQKKKADSEPEATTGHSESSSEEVERSTDTVQSSGDFQILLCCTDVLLLYSLKSLIQGNADSFQKVKLPKSICWTTTFKIDEENYGLLVLCQDGSTQIRSLPKFEVLGELSVMSMLRWNLKTNMDKLLSSTENGHFSLVNGCEFALVSLLARENDFRIPQCLPCLHDKALAAAVNMKSSQNKKKNKETPAGVLVGIIKGLRKSKDAQRKNHVDDQQSIRSSLDKIFSRFVDDPSSAAKDSEEVAELHIDDIAIDGTLHVSPVNQKNEHGSKDKTDTSSERKKLFEGASSETKAKPRTVEEIKAKYRKGGETSSAVSSAASAASEARNKLMERQEKLERINQNSEELRNGAENFASMAQQLRKKMENRKWWQI